MGKDELDVYTRSGDPENQKVERGSWVPSGWRKSAGRAGGGPDFCTRQILNTGFACFIPFNNPHKGVLDPFCRGGSIEQGHL